jgi:thiamine biosynthesis lipoprotein
MATLTDTARSAGADVAGADVAGAEVVAVDLEALGVQVRLVVTAPAVLTAATEELTRRLDRLDLACSRFRDDSELCRLDARAGRTTPVSPLLADLVAVALRAAQLTDGVVDPTVGSAVAAAGYDRDFALVSPDGPAIRLVRRAVPGWRRVRLVRPVEGTDQGPAELTVPAGVRLDLGATAKAWAADDAATGLAAQFGCGVLVGLGGDLAMAGPAPDGGWPIRVQDVTGHPDQAPVGPASTVALLGGGVATSSVTARRWTRGGVVLHHLIDPVTGLPARTPWRTVTVAAGSCVDANIASTWAMVRGTDAVERLARLGLPARLVAVDGTVTTAAGWPAEGDR